MSKKVCFNTPFYKKKIIIILFCKVLIYRQIKNNGQYLILHYNNYYFQFLLSLYKIN